MPALSGGYELDDDPGRLDRDAIWDFLSTEAYWNRWRTRDGVEAEIAAAWRVVGLYCDGTQVGFGRVMSDGASVAYLDDVYILAGHRGKGLGRALVSELVNAAGGERMRWFLHTADAHAFYARLGFVQAPEWLMEREPQRPPMRPGGQ